MGKEMPPQNNTNLKSMKEFKEVHLDTDYSLMKFPKVNIFFFAFGRSQLTNLQFILCYVAGFYKPAIPQGPPSHLQDYSTCNNARLELSTMFVPSFDPNELCMKNGPHSGGSNSQPFSHESSALTTRPRLLA